MRSWRRNPELLRDAATLVPIAAAVLLLAPFILIFAAPVRIGGVPLIVAYVFGAWAAIIVVALLVARGHDAADGGQAGPAAGEPDRR